MEHREKRMNPQVELPTTKRKDGFVIGEGLGELGTGGISTIPYVSQSFYEKEKEIWKNSWLCVGQVGDLKRAGDFFTFDLKVVNTPIFVIRGKDARLRAFYNVCSHRCSRLVGLAAGESSGRLPGGIVCRYHGWSYGLDGSLRTIREPQLFPDLPAKQQLGLKQISVDTWCGFIFVNLAKKPESGLEEYMSKVSKSFFALASGSDWIWGRGFKGVVRANWKDLLNIQQESYHVTILHRRTLATVLTPDVARNTVYRDSGISSVYTGPTPSGTDGAKLTAVQKVTMRHGDAPPRVDAATSKAAFAESAGIEEYTVFPNLMIGSWRGTLATMRVWPLGPRRTLWEWDWFFPKKPKNFGEFLSREYAAVLTRNTVAEDWIMVEHASEGMQSGVRDGTYVAADMEASCRALHERLLDKLGLTEADLNDYAS